MLLVLATVPDERRALGLHSYIGYPGDDIPVHPNNMIEHAQRRSNLSLIIDCASRVASSQDLQEQI